MKFLLDQYVYPSYIPTYTIIWVKLKFFYPCFTKSKLFSLNSRTTAKSSFIQITSQTRIAIKRELARNTCFRTRRMRNAFKASDW